MTICPYININMPQSHRMNITNPDASLGCLCYCPKLDDTLSEIFHNSCCCYISSLVFEVLQSVTVYTINQLQCIQSISNSVYNQSINQKSVSETNNNVCLSDE